MPSTDRTFRTPAIILRRHDLGEADRILTLFTRNHGKIRAVAKGVRRPTSRKAGHVELFTHVDALIAHGRSLNVLSQVDTLNPYAPLRGDLVRTTYASHFVELVDAFTEEADENRPLFDLLRDSLEWVCQTDDLQRTARYYELHLLELVGYRPELFHCVNCGRELKPQNQYYSVINGGAVCPICSSKGHRGRPLSLNALKVLRYLQTRPFHVVESLTLSAGVQLECERILHETLTYNIERRLKSAAFLRRLRREQS